MSASLHWLVPFGIEAMSTRTAEKILVAHPETTEQQAVAEKVEAELRGGLAAISASLDAATK